jgi:SAM-dependent methyltransferase
MARIGGALDGCTVLEVGCGRGVGAELLLDRLGAASVDAIDADPVMVRLASRRLDGRAGVALQDITELPPPAIPFDAVVDFGALHLIPDWPVALRNIHRALRPGGRFFFEEIVRPARQAFVPLATGRRIPGRFAKRALLDELHDVGFEVLGYTEPRLAALTAMVGDLIGVAVRQSCQAVTCADPRRAGSSAAAADDGTAQPRSRG